MRAVVQGCSRQDAWNIILPLPRTDSPYGAGWPGMTECHPGNRHPLKGATQCAGAIVVSWSRQLGQQYSAIFA